MKNLLLVLCLILLSLTVYPNTAVDVKNWEQRAKNVTIIRDDWGIPHIFGKRDADVVFGMIYAQAEDDFNRIETNYLNSMGRLAEAEGEKAIYSDLRMKLFIDPAEMKAQYKISPPWLKALMDAWADGLNYYLSKHPEVKPRVIKQFEPWMAITFSEGSIGGDIETISVRDLENFYGKTATAKISDEDDSYFKEPGGSNGFAIAPSNTANGHSLLLINPHTSFFFREELQMVSEEGLNAYGAVTWGQFFIYQGFNNRVGWMHTSSGVDNIDEYLETVKKTDKGFTYQYGKSERPVKSEKITVAYQTPGGMATKDFTIYRTHHGPIVRQENGKWVSVQLMNSPLKALTQSYSRIKAKNYQEFRKIMDLHTNSSNNTIYADADGKIAYFHANFIPKRDPDFDWTKPVDGSDPATDWKGVHSVEESPHLLNPANGWLYNTNNYPFSAAGANSPKQADFPKYMERGSENPRGIHAVRVLENKKDFTLDSLITAAFDSYLPEFAKQIPPLVKSFDEAPASDPLKTKLAEQIKLLRNWNYRWSGNSVETSLAIYWAEDLIRRSSSKARENNINVSDYMSSKATDQERLESLSAAVDKLTADFGKWQTQWGEINRFQRLNGDIVQPFNDAGASIPVAFTSSQWGSLASFGARQYPGTKKRYGTSGNSFVAVVEFGDKVTAKAVTAGGLNSNPSNRHFNDQADRYSKGNLRDVYFYRSQLKDHTEREYQPGN
jgi:acyl-homoserine-lactone acylase